jgi:N-acetylmuramoyl-L-alanine amidase
MQIKKKTFGLLLFIGLVVFTFGQQNNRSSECLNQANEYKDSVFILIDPGHGCDSNNGLACLPGGRYGAVDDPKNVTYSEACMTTDLALRLRDILEGIGLDVGMTSVTSTMKCRKKCDILSS